MITYVTQRQIGDRLAVLSVCREQTAAAYLYRSQKVAIDHFESMARVTLSVDGNGFEK